MVGTSPFTRRKAMSALVETGGGSLVPPARQPIVRVPPKTQVEPDRRDAGGYVTMDMVRVAKERWDGLRLEKGERHPATIAAKSAYDDVRWQWERQEGRAWAGGSPIKSLRNKYRRKFRSPERPVLDVRGNPLRVGDRVGVLTNTNDREWRPGTITEINYHPRTNQPLVRVDFGVGMPVFWDAYAMMKKSLRRHFKSAGTCKQGERSDLTGCTPADGSGGGPSSPASPSGESSPWQKRQAGRDSRSAVADEAREAASAIESPLASFSVGEGASVADATASARDGWERKWGGVASKLAEAGAGKASVAKIASAVSKAKTGIDKAAASYEKAFAKLTEVEQSLAALEAEEPQLEEPERPAEDAGEDEFEAWDAAVEKATAAHEKALEKWQQKVDKVQEKIDAATERHDSAWDDLESEYAEANEALSGLAGDAADDAQSRIESEASEDDIPEDEYAELEEQTRRRAQGGKSMMRFVAPSPFLVKRLRGVLFKAAGTCKQGERSDLTGCTPASGDDPKSSKRRGRGDEETGERRFAKKKAVKGKMVSAKREGTGKNAKVLLSNGEPAPAHITPAMVPPAMKRVRISMDPDADVLVTGMIRNEKTGKDRKATVYNEKYAQGNAAIKFARVQEMLAKSAAIDDQIQKARKNPETAADADCAWLMRVQATRPGGEADTKGLAKLYDQPFGADNIDVVRKVAPKTKKVTFAGALTFDVDGKKVRVPIRDQRTAAWLHAAKESGDPEDLQDARYWLQSFGATTLEGRHVIDAEDGVHLVFVGKEGVAHDHKVADPDLAAMLLERAEKAGTKGRLFEGASHGSVTKFTKGLDGGEFTPKDFRTKRAAELAIEEIKRIGDSMDDGTGVRHKIDPSDSIGAHYYAKAVRQVAEKVSGVLGNRAEQALESYIPPEVFSVWQNAGGSKEAS